MPKPYLPRALAKGRTQATAALRDDPHHPRVRLRSRGRTGTCCLLLSSPHSKSHPTPGLKGIWPNALRRDEDK
ncbi:hypothetical protein NPIL_360951 [Nephila pilipes]|uniref:Uncharacterized protein n=1 Tax=Nephila pilipes TaxID=299642 RepID=A0A8X6P0H5_NEPPI|nr:hypothetical protein NPIL_360951 [Nephila pilipes]